MYIVTPAGDPLFQQAVAGARRAAMVNLLHRAGIDVSRFFVDSMVAGTENNAWLSNDLDRERPTLTTTSVPARGTRVAAGDEITVTMVVRDDADPAHWQTGVKTIQLVAESEGGAFVASENYEACADVPERRVVATYTVPENPPPVVRLSALAEDHTELMDSDAAEFFTGEVWKGTVTLERDGANPQCSAITSNTEFTVAVAGDGEASGEGILDHGGYTCLGEYTAPASRAAVKIAGKKQDGKFTLFLNGMPVGNSRNPLPRMPAGYWIVQVGQGSTGEGTFAFGNMAADVVFRVRLECQTCGRP